METFHWNQICRLCLTDCLAHNDTVLVEIFSSIVNETGKAKLIEKIFSTTGIKITKNDGIFPSKICHKCLVSIESFVEFRDKVRKSDEKLRNLMDSENQDDEDSPLDEDDEIIKLDPNKLYESSDDEPAGIKAIQNNETPLQPIVKSVSVKETVQMDQQSSNAISAVSINKRKDIFYCKYCDIVFSDLNSCTSHENLNHDPASPYKCQICSSKFKQHQNLIIHIKMDHITDKPFFCALCSKDFIRRSDLKKHAFIHSGIRMFTCNICSKSFTRSTNLAKHKKIHQNQNVQKSFKCTLCPKAYGSNAELSDHMEIHMNRNTFNCKYCNQVFTQRDEMDAHQKSHISPTKSSQLVTGTPPVASSSIVFYNKNPLEEQVQQPVAQQNQTPMNFYTENIEPVAKQSQTKIEYPIMNQLLSNFNNSVYKCDKCLEQFPTPHLLQNHKTLYHSKNFTCGICSSSYYKKKELDRHVMAAHTDIRYNCSKCSKSFSRKDKLARHERTHLIPAFYNCALCPAVFIRKHLLDVHSKIHLLPATAIMPENSALVNSLNLEQYSQPKPPIETFIPSFISPVKQGTPLDLSAVKHHINPQASLFPMNLSANHEHNVINEPMDLSNDKVVQPKIVIDSDDDDLRIIENNNHDEDAVSHLNPKTDEIVSKGLCEQKEGEEMADPKNASFSMRLDLDKLEPSRDLPMEILQSPNV